MKYMTIIKGESVNDAREISKEEARLRLDDNWSKEALDDIFNNNKAFRLYTGWRDIWTVSDDGLVPQPGFYGVCD